MNEVENHYSGQSGSHEGGSGKPRSSSSADVAKSALDQASARAKEGLKSATNTVKASANTAREAVGDGYGRAKSWASDQYGSASGTISAAGRRSAATAGDVRNTVERFVEENPVMIGVAGLAAGLLAGALLPGTRRENQVFGRYADEVRDQGLRYARDLAEQGKQFVEENLETVAKGRSDRDLGDETTAR